MKSILHKTPAAYSAESCKKAIDWFEENIDITRAGSANNVLLKNLELPIPGGLKSPSDFI